MKEQPVSGSGASFILALAAFLILLAIPISIGARAQSQAVSAASASASEPSNAAAQDVSYVPQEVAFTLRTTLGGDPAMAFVGVGGEIDGVVNPDLSVNAGDHVTVTVINGDAVAHDLVIDAFGVTTGQMTEDEQQVVIEFTANQVGTFEYYCSIPGHREIGMYGNLVISGEVAPTSSGAAPVAAVAAVPTVAPADPNAAVIIRNPAEVPPPVGDRDPMTLRVDMTTQEVVGQLADGTTMTYFTFDGTVPGPMLRLRLGDTVEFHLANDENSLFVHSIDSHAVTGPGGGAVFTQTNPGEETAFTFQAINPGLYVYHCATASIPHHIQSGMYGLMLVEPPGGLPPVDREFYVMQGDIYTEQPFGTEGNLTFSADHMAHEDADYLVFNGAAGALTQDQYALRAEVGDTVRIFFGVGGPNYMSSFHVIGEIFDRVYDQASLTADPLTDVQTTIVPPGGATMVEFTVDVPGRYILVDHALSRLERGLAGFMYVEGEDQPAIFSGSGEASTEGH